MDFRGVIAKLERPLREPAWQVMKVSTTVRGLCFADYFFDVASCSIARISAAIVGLTPSLPAPPRPPAPPEAAPAPRPALLAAAAGVGAPPRPRPPPSPATPTRSIGFLPLASTSS